MPHDLVEINVGSGAERDADSASRENESRDLEGLLGQNFARADMVELMSSMLMARIVRLEGEVFALRHQLAQLRRSQGSATDDRSTEP